MINDQCLLEGQIQDTVELGKCSSYVVLSQLSASFSVMLMLIRITSRRIPLSVIPATADELDRAGLREAPLPNKNGFFSFSLCVSVCLSVCLPVCLSPLSVSLSVCLCLSLPTPLCVSACLSVCLSLSLSPSLLSFLWPTPHPRTCFFSWLAITILCGLGRQ